MQGLLRSINALAIMSNKKKDPIEIFLLFLSDSIVSLRQSAVQYSGIQNVLRLYSVPNYAKVYGFSVVLVRLGYIVKFAQIYIFL